MFYIHWSIFLTNLMIESMSYSCLLIDILTSMKAYLIIYLFLFIHLFWYKHIKTSFSKSIQSKSCTLLYTNTIMLSLKDKVKTLKINSSLYQNVKTGRRIILFIKKKILIYYEVIWWTEKKGMVFSEKNNLNFRDIRIKKKK